MGALDWANQYLGQHLFDNSGNYWGECVSFVKRYAQEAQGVPNADSVLYVKGDLAKNMYLKPNPPSLDYYDLVDSNPQEGDIAVYGNPNDNRYGDVAVVIGGGKVVGQLGFPIYAPVAIRNIGSPLGYLRRKGGTMPDQPTTFNEANSIYQNILRRNLSQQEWNDFEKGKSFRTVYDEVANSQEKKDRFAKESKWEADSKKLAEMKEPETLEPGIYEVPAQF